VSAPKRRFDWEEAERLWASGEHTQSALAVRYGVKRQAVSFAIRTLRERRARGVTPRELPPGRGLNSRCSGCGETGHDVRRHRREQEVADGAS
jgi:hypothetical protein